MKFFWALLLSYITFKLIEMMIKSFYLRSWGLFAINLTLTIIYAMLAATSVAGILAGVLK